MNQSAGTFSTVASADGTTIAFERRGSGPPVVLVGGALNDRRWPGIAGAPMAEQLAGDFAAYAYDRRGRGESTNTAPYAVEREVEDLAALIAHIGRPVLMFGHSSGAALALEAAASGLAIARLAVYEPPYSMNASAEAESRASADKIGALLRDGRNADATAYFMAGTGMPEEMIEQIRRSPDWARMESMAPTLAHDMAIMRSNGASFPPRDRIRTIQAPVLAMAGSASPDWMREAAQAVAEAAPRGAYLELEGRNHMISPDALAPHLNAFFLQT